MKLTSLGIVCCALWLGCARHVEDRPQLVPITGMITLNGKPLPKAAVAFNPTVNGNSSYGRTNENGEYSLMYNGQEPGAVVGTHRVEIRTKEEIVDREGKVLSDQPEILPEKYHNQSNLTADVKADSKTINFELKK